MKYLDTNILVRLITNDSPNLTRQAIDWVQSSKTGECMVLDAVLVETCFVLEFHEYQMKRHDIYQALTAFLDLPQTTCASASLGALQLFNDHPSLDYADCLLLTLGGKKDIVSFVKALTKVAQTL